MRARTFAVPAGGLPYRCPEPLPAIACAVAPVGDFVVPRDRLSEPTGDALLPQVLLDAPRGAAWQSDELMPPLGTTVQHRVWAVVADALADYYRRLTRASLAAFPSATDEDGVAAWETDFGLPDPCLGDNPSLAQRRQAIRAALALPDTASRQDLVCLLRSAGFDLAIDEWEGFEFGLNGFGDEGFGHPDLPHLFFVRADGLELTWLALGEIGFGEEGFGSLPADGLICLIERSRQAHTRAVYLIQGAVL